MGYFAILNEKNEYEETVYLEKINNLDFKKYIFLAVSEEERQDALNNQKYALNYPLVSKTLYNFNKRKFKNNSPFLSWVWNEQLFEWEAPIKCPNVFLYEWNEDLKNWIKIKTI
jgi:hypothetical protein